MLSGQDVWEHLLMCSYGDISLELLLSSKQNNLLDMMDSSDIGALRHERLGTKLSQIAIGNESVAGVKVVRRTMRVLAH